MQFPLSLALATVLLLRLAPSAASAPALAAAEAADAPSSGSESSAVEPGGTAADPAKEGSVKPIAAPCPPPEIPPADAQAAADAALAYLGALQDGGLAAAAAHLHPGALARFQALLLPAFEAERERGTRALLNATFGRDASFGDVRLAAPADFMGRFARVVSAREPDVVPSFASAAALGTVKEGERLHVLVKLAPLPGSGGVERLTAVTLLPERPVAAPPGERVWKVVLDDRLEGLARSLAERTGGGPRRAGLPRMGPIPEGLPPVLGPVPDPTALPPAPAAPPPSPGR